jgi:uncharacterized protein
MNEEQNIAVVKEQIYSAFARGDVPTILNALADDVEWRSPGPNLIPWAGTWRGRESVATWLSKVAEAAEFEEFQPRDFFASGDKVMVLGYERFRVKATGRVLANELAQLYVLRDGKITQFCEYYDTAAVAETFRRG